jgi:hypothetical protein
VGRARLFVTMASGSYWLPPTSADAVATQISPQGMLVCIHMALSDPDLIIAVWDRRLHAGAASAELRLAPAHLPVT